MERPRLYGTDGVRIDCISAELPLDVPPNHAGVSFGTQLNAQGVGDDLAFVIANEQGIGVLGRLDEQYYSSLHAMGYVMDLATIVLCAAKEKARGLPTGDPGNTRMLLFGGAIAPGAYRNPLLERNLRLGYAENLLRAATALRIDALYHGGLLTQPNASYDVRFVPQGGTVGITWYDRTQGPLGLGAGVIDFETGLFRATGGHTIGIPLRFNRQIRI